MCFTTIFATHLQMLTHAVFVVWMRRKWSLQRRSFRDLHGFQLDNAGVMKLVCNRETMTTDTLKPW